VVKQKADKGKASSAAVSVTIKGSDTVLPLAQKKQKSDENKF
jgi:ABC-type phosphate transport system substrate-binding protein